MVVGILRIEIRLAENHSLKGKRSVLRKMKAQVRSRFNVSIAECDAHDAWQRAVLGVAQVGTDEPHVDRCLREVSRHLESMGLAELGAEELEFIHL